MEMNYLPLQHKKSGSKLIADDKAGVKYPGALEDVCNLNGVPAVTCEVLALHGTLNKNRINKSCNQMFALLNILILYRNFQFVEI